MGNQTSQLIAAYVARVDILQKQQQDALSAAELKSIARELGMAEADLAYADRAAQDHLTRGQGYLEHGLLDDALQELQAAVVLRPLDAATILALAEAHAARWRLTRNAGSRSEADQLARQALVLDPELSAAYRLRQTLAGTTASAAAASSSSSGRSVWLWLTLAGGLGVGLVALVLGWLVMAPAAEPIEPFSPQSAVEISPPSVATVARQPAVVEDLAVRVAPLTSLPVLEPQTRHISLHEFSDSWSLETSGVLVNTSDQMLLSVSARLELLDAAGRVVASQMVDVHEDYQARLRPGDMARYDVLLYEDHYAADYSRPVAAVLTMVSAETVAAAASYPPATPVTLGWIPPSPPPGLEIEAAVRQVSVSENKLLDTVHFRGEYEIHLPEGSASAELLKLRLEFLDAAGAVIGTDDSYVVSSREPALVAGETQVVQFLASLKQAPASQRLLVVEAR